MWALLPLQVAADDIGPQRLLQAYPEHLERIENGILVWRDGTRMSLDDGRSNKTFDEWLSEPDIEDMFLMPYRAHEAPAAPPPGSDPGRARNDAFFNKLYGDCRKGEVKPQLTTISWLPQKSGQRILVTRVNRVDARLESISSELDALPKSFDTYLKFPASTYACRTIAGTPRISAHGSGIAIDIAVPLADYWQWQKRSDGEPPQWRNRIPLEIISIFEKHGFIWGGRWHHYDTMHFEYRPELIDPLP